MDNVRYLLAKLFGDTADGSGGQEQTSFSAHKIIAFGNVLLDFTAVLPDTTLLKRHNLKLEERAEMDSDKLHKIIDEASNIVDCIRNPGGAALNTTRMLKHLGTDVFFFGSLGDDQNADLLREVLKTQGLAASLETVKGVPTGRCVCLVHENSTALYANVGASQHFTINHLKEMESDPTRMFLRPAVRKQLIYMEGFFAPQRCEVCQYIVDKYVQGRRRFAFNLSSPIVVEENFEIVMYLLEKAYFVFGNKQEFQALANKMGVSNFEDMANKLLQGAKILVITNGGEDVTLITNVCDEQSPPAEIRFEEFKAMKIDQVVDTTGCGDAFVAGFLHSWLKKATLTECVCVGMTIAAKVATQIGCNLPKE